MGGHEEGKCHVSSLFVLADFFHDKCTGYKNRRANRLLVLSKPQRLNIQNIMLPAVLYGCETWSLILREEHRLSVYEYSVLKTISGP
jgi:hypothetical protein